MPIQVSPGAYVSERDFSLYAPALGTSVFAVVGTASKGPTDTPTLITDEATLVATFGRPSVTHLGLFSAVHYLRKGRQLIFIRVADYDIAAGTVTIQDAAAAGTAIQISPTSSGSWANGMQIVISAGTMANSYRLVIRETINNRIHVVESYDNLLIGDATPAANTNYIEVRLNGVSERITVVDTGVYTTLVAGTSTFAGGADGAPANDSDIIGTVGSPPTVPPTGLQSIANAEVWDVNIVATPGYNSATVVAALITFCVTRGDCLALLGVPYGKTVQEALAWHDGTGGGASDPAAALNTSYAALYYPWLQVYDGYADANVWIPPEGHVAAAIAFTDYTTDPWFAPAGLNRALLTDVIDIEHSPTQGERDQMYSYGNALNPICNYQGQGFTIWGQRTLQRAPTALDRVNVRRLLLYMEKVIATAVRYLVFEPNDERTWSQFTNLVNPLCRAVMNRRGLYDFRVICDDTTNTSDVVNRNEMVGKILLQPTKTAEMIIIEFVLLPTGARFEEFVA